MDTYGSRLKSLRSAADLTQTKLASMIGVTQSAINRYENSQSEPIYRILNWYADHFDVSLDYILCRTDKPQGKVYEYEPNGIKEKMKDNREWAQFIEACFEPNSPMNEKLKQAILNMSGGAE